MKYNDRDTVLLSWSITRTFLDPNKNQASPVCFAKLTMDEWKWMSKRLKQVKDNNEGDFFLREDDPDVTKAVSMLFKCSSERDGSWISLSRPKWYSTFHLIWAEQLSKDNENSFDTIVHYSHELRPIHLDVPEKGKDKVILLAWTQSSIPLDNSVNVDDMDIKFVRVTTRELDRIKQIMKKASEEGGDCLIGDSSDADFLRTILARDELDGPTADPKYCAAFSMASIERINTESGINNSAWTYSIALPNKTWRI